MTSAHVITLISKDLEPIIVVVRFVPLAIGSLIEVPAACVVLWFLVAPEAAVGFVLVLFAWIFKTKMKSLLRTLRSRTAALTDQRLLVIANVALGIRTLKMNCWERTFEEIAGETRR